MNCDIQRKCFWGLLFTFLKSEENHVIVSDKISGTNLATMVHLRTFIIKYIRTANSSKSRSESGRLNTGSFLDTITTSVKESS